MNYYYKVLQLCIENSAYREINHAHLSTIYSTYIHIICKLKSVCCHSEFHATERTIFRQLEGSVKLFVLYVWHHVIPLECAVSTPPRAFFTFRY